jgi:D-aminopeptidase
MQHSSSAIYEVLANGHVVGETELNMVLLARLGIPFIFGSGDDQYCAFSQVFFPNAVFVTTKWDTGRYGSADTDAGSIEEPDPRWSRCRSL